MSAPAAVRRQPQRQATRGYFECPNSLAENQALLTPAERALALLLFRRDEGSVITDETWTKWTGLEPRSKNYAAAGLRKKGLEVQGEGDRARYTFHRHRWDNFVRTAEPVERPRTEGRAETPAPGAKVHPECRENGCSLLRAKAVGLLCGPVESKRSGEVAQPVAQANSPKEPALATANGGKDSVNGGERAWAKTLGALRSAFALIGVFFVMQLLAEIRRRSPGLPDPTDEELAAAVELAWSTTKHKQKHPGLFKDTVPEALRVLRANPLLAHPPRGERERREAQVIDEMRARLIRGADALRRHGQKAASVQAAALAEKLSEWTLEEVCGQVDELEGWIVAALLADGLGAKQRAEVVRRSVELVQTLRLEGTPAEQVAVAERIQMREDVLKAAGLPSLVIGW